MQTMYIIAAIVCLLRIWNIDKGLFDGFVLDCYKDFAHMFVVWCVAAYYFRRDLLYYFQIALILIFVEITCFVISRVIGLS